MVYCSVVIPVHNEAENLVSLHLRLTETLRSLGKAYEIILVDDGSTDQSHSILRELHEQDQDVSVIKLSRNFGHHAAITAGIDYARGDIIVTMDGDLQHQPEDIPALIDNLSQGFDVVFGTRTGRRESVMKRVGSRMLVAIMNRIAAPGFTLHSSVFLAMKRKVADGLGQCRETSRFLPGLISWLGFKQGTVEVQDGTRSAGRSKYTLGRSVSLAVNIITAFSFVPLRAGIWLGLCIFFLSIAGASSIVVRKLVWDIPIQGYPSLIVAVLFIGGVQLIILGISGEYIGRAYTQMQNRPLYVVDDVLRSHADEPRAGPLPLHVGDTET